MQITSLKPKLTEVDAARLLKGAWRELRYGRLRLTFDFYVPYYFFNVSVTNASRTTNYCLAMDAVAGELDPYFFDALPDDEQLVSLDAKYVLAISVSEAEAQQRLQEFVKRRVMMQGFFKTERLSINAELQSVFYLPRCAGVYEQRHRVRLEVIDALRCRLEGRKMQNLLTAWFESPGETVNTLERNPT